MGRLEIYDRVIKEWTILTKKDGIIYAVWMNYFIKISDIFGDAKASEELLTLLSKVKQKNLGLIEELCVPELEILFRGAPVGYATENLSGYKDLIESCENLTFLEKLVIIIKISIAIQKMHCMGVSHTDLYSDNILINGNDVKIIDFDELKTFEVGQKMEYFNSPFCDIAQINNLFLRIIVKNGKIPINGDLVIDIPDEIKRYLSFYDINDFSHIDEIVEVKSVDNIIYPHQWLLKLKSFVDADIKKVA